MLRSERDFFKNMIHLKAEKNPCVNKPDHSFKTTVIAKTELSKFFHLSKLMKSTDY